MSHRSFSFFKSKLRDFKWSIIFAVIIMFSVSSWLLSSSIGLDVETSVENYSKVATFIRVDRFSHTPRSHGRLEIPNNIVEAIEGIQFVEKVYRVYVFDLAIVAHNVSISGLNMTTTFLLYNPAIIVKLGELSDFPPFIVDVNYGSLPQNGNELALTSSSKYKVGDEVEVALDEDSIVEVRVSGLLTRSLLSPAEIVVHKDFLLRIPGGDQILENAIKGVCTVLFIKIDYVYHVEDVLGRLNELLTESEYQVICDEYLVEKTIQLNDQASFTVKLLNYGILFVSAALVTLMSYFSVNVRRWEIGLLKSLGFSKNEIRKAYSFYLFTISVFGWVTALAVIYTVGNSIKSLMLNVLNLGNMISTITIHLSPTVILLSFVIITIVTVASILIIISLALRRHVEADLREF